MDISVSHSVMHLFYNGFLYNLIVLVSTKFGIPFDIDYINTILISSLELELG